MGSIPAISSVIMAFLISFTPRIAWSQDTFDIQARISSPGMHYDLHLKGEYPQEKGWILAPWIVVNDCLTLNHSKFKSLHIYIKRIDKNSAEPGISAADMLTGKIKPLLKTTQKKTGVTSYNPYFKVIFEKEADIGKHKDRGFQAEYHYDNPDNQILAVKYYIVDQGSHMNLITFTGLLTEFTAFRSSFDKFVASLEFIS